MLSRKPSPQTISPAPYNPKKQMDAGTASGLFAPLFDMDRLDEALSNFEKIFIARKLAENDQDVVKTARKLHVDKSYLKKQLAKK